MQKCVKTLIVAVHMCEDIIDTWASNIYILLADGVAVGGEAIEPVVPSK